jgi:hypothetical protein
VATIQTKNAIADMLAAGFRRSEFKVAVEKFYRGAKAGVKLVNGRGFYEYGDAKIYFTRLTTEQKLERIAEALPVLIERGLGVTYMLLKADGDKPLRVAHVYVSTRYEDRGKVSFQLY